jgi:hypothetical protein
MSIPSLSSHLIASARCYRHDYLVTDRRSTATLICDGAARSCFHTQASLSRSVIGSANSPGGGPSRSLIIRARFAAFISRPARAEQSVLLNLADGCGEIEVRILSVY